MTFKLFLLALLASLVSLAAALPLVVRDVWAPPITYPNASTVWIVGRTYTVTWNTSSAPSEVTNPEGNVYLRRNGLTDLTPLTAPFPLSAGEVNVTVPADTTPADDWIVVLIGDSGDFSDPFAIVAS